MNQLGDTMLSDKPLWYAIQTKAKEEGRAESNLESWGVKTFVPRIKELRCQESSVRRARTAKCLFPRYIFAKFNAASLLHAVNFTRGVCKVIGFGNGPTPVDDILIDTIKSRIGAGGFLTLDDDFNCGDRVVIKAGLFEDFQGTVARDLKDWDRLVVLLSAVSYEGRLLIEKALVKKVAPVDDRLTT